MPRSVSVLLVDDEPLARANLRLALRSAPEWKVEAESSNAAEALAFLESHRVDVVFLDIKMPGASGLDVARTLVERDNTPIIVFVTAHHEHAVAAFEVHAIDYLIKPIDDRRLAITVARIDEALKTRNAEEYRSSLRGLLEDSETPSDASSVRYPSRLSVRSVGRVDAVELSQVRWIRTAGNYVELMLAGRTVLHRITLETLARQLDPAVFIRVHRTAIVRRSQCASLIATGDGTYELVLRSGARVPVSRRYLGAVRRCMGV